MAEEEIKYSYDMDYFVKWSHGKVYELYDRLSGKRINSSDMKPDTLAEITTHAYFYGITTDEKTFYKLIEKTLEKGDIAYASEIE